MIRTAQARNGMVTSPHHLASQAGLQILRDGGTAVEAAIAIAATLSVVYPHMTGIGGDGFWLIVEPGAEPIAIDGAGATGADLSPDVYEARGLSEVPTRGPLAANTIAGTISAWRTALELSTRWQSTLGLERLLRDAVAYAEEGFCVSESQEELANTHLTALGGQPGFAETFLVDGRPPAAGRTMRLPRLAETFRSLARDGLSTFYEGSLASTIAEDFETLGVPLSAADLRTQSALAQTPLSLKVKDATLFNLGAPTQGLASLMILGLFDRLEVKEADTAAHIHGLVEATKQAFLIRDRVITDPGAAPTDLSRYLSAPVLDHLAAKIDMARALPWPAAPSGGDTTWFGAVDCEGRAVSVIQSLYFEFGSGVVLPQSGIVWQNRGCSLSLAPNALNRLRPRAKPFHTLNPAMARFDDGRLMVYGTMGGEGQPQTQAALFTRYARFEVPLQRAVTQPRWLLGRTWGAPSASLKIEDGVPPAVVEALVEAGHPIERTPAFSSLMGHAGAIVRHPDGVMEGAADPRSDGAVASW